VKIAVHALVKEKVRQCSNHGGLPRQWKRTKYGQKDEKNNDCERLTADAEPFVGKRSQ
jgi:hypothetical protein